VSDYTTESELSVRARRRRRALVTIGVVVLALFFAFWYALSYYQADIAAGPSRTPAATCEPFDPKALTPAKVKVNVYNASNRTGLAATVSKELAERTFVIGTVANDPSNRKAPAVAEVRHGPSGKAQAALLRTALPKGTTVVQDKRKGATVDVALGPKWTRLAPVSTAEALPLCPVPTES
jgi:hypothetical protein